MIHIEWHHIERWRVVLVLIVVAVQIIGLPLAMRFAPRPPTHEEVAGMAILIGVEILIVGAFVRGWLRQKDAEAEKAANQ